MMDYKCVESKKGCLSYSSSSSVCCIRASICASKFWGSKFSFLYIFPGQFDCGHMAHSNIKRTGTGKRITGVIFITIGYFIKVKACRLAVKRNYFLGKISKCRRLVVIRNHNIYSAFGKILLCKVFFRIKNAALL